MPQLYLVKVFNISITELWLWKLLSYGDNRPLFAVTVENELEVDTTGKWKSNVAGYRYLITWSIS